MAQEKYPEVDDEKYSVHEGREESPLTLALISFNAGLGAHRGQVRLRLGLRALAVQTEEASQRAAQETRHEGGKTATLGLSGQVVDQDREED